jgi:hypothetical protein
MELLDVLQLKVFGKAMNENEWHQLQCMVGRSMVDAEGSANVTPLLIFVYSPFLDTISPK